MILPLLVLTGGAQVARPEVPSSGQSDLARAEQAVAEGKTLERQETADSTRQAIERFRAAAEIFRALGETKREAQTLLDLGEAYQTQGDPARALEANSRSLELWRQMGDPRGEAESLTQLGMAALETGDHEKARTSLQGALAIFRSRHDAQGEGAALNTLGQLYDLLSQRGDALRTFEQALAASRSANDRREEASILNNLGMFFYRGGDGEAALRSFRDALPLMEAEGFKRGHAIVLNNMGLAFEALGDKQQAADSYQSLLPIVQALGDPLLEAGVHSNLGGIFYDMGEAENALAHHQKTLVIWRRAKQTAYEAVALNNIGAVYYSLGEYELALDNYNQSLPLRQATQDRRGQATTLSNMGDVFARQRDFPKALEYQGKALSLIREAGDRRNEAGVLHNLARTYAAAGEQRKALEIYLQAAAIRREIGDRLGLSITLTNLGTTYRELGEVAASQEAYAESLALARETGDRPGEAVIHLGMSRLLQRTGKPEAALEEIQKAVEILESRRSLTNSQNLRSSLFVALGEYYEQYIDLLFDLRKAGTSPDAEARSLEISERARSRNLLDTLLEARAEVRKGSPPDLLTAERQLQQQINRKELEWRRMRKEGAANQDSERVRREGDELLRRLDEVRAEIRVRSPEYAALTQPEPLHTPEIQALLDPDTLLLSYFLGEERSFVWAVTRSSLAARELPPRAEIETAARELHSLQSRSDQRLARKPAERAALRLASMLLDPIKNLLGKKRLVIIADGSLHYIPFAGLPDPNRPGASLVVEHEIVNLPSASVLAVLRRETADRSPGPRKVAVLADPVFDSNDPRLKLRAETSPSEPSAQALLVQRAARDLGLDGFPRLRYTREEAEGIASLLPPGEVFKALDFDASKETATGGDLSRYRILHFATHGLLDTRRPELSGLVLSLVDREGRPRDGFLRLHEIYNLDLPSDLVVLSGCETALGKEVRGEGLIALTRGFMYAGAPSVVASLWRVDDRSTAELMRRFYRAMLKQGLSPAAALRAAQVSLWKERPTAAPYFWAGFVFQGDWR